jgi:uncharacterized protein involved in type VI secretion and phage assembly
MQVQVPAVGGNDALSWAEACVAWPATLVPQIGAAVWVMFEAGDPSRPVWVGTLVD